jgi:NADPH2:quinone reductase
LTATDHIGASFGLREIKDRLISTLPLPAMKAFVVHELAHPSKIKLTEEWPTPVLGENQIMVDVYSAGINFFDVSEVKIFLSARPIVAHYLDITSPRALSNQTPSPLCAGFRVCW